MTKQRHNSAKGYFAVDSGYFQLFALAVDGMLSHRLLHTISFKDPKDLVTYKTVSAWNTAGDAIFLPVTTLTCAIPWASLRLTPI